MAHAAKWDQSDDQTLVTAAQRGDQAALDALVRRYHGPLAQFLDRMLGDPEAAGDVAQETLLKMIRALPRYQPRAKFSTWLYTIATNLARDHLRRSRHRDRWQQSLDDPDHGPDEPATEHGLVADRAVLTLTREDVRRALETLSPEHRAVMLLHYFEGLSYKEIAQALGCTIGTVGSRLHYAIRHLRRQFGAATEDQP
jgi:RNA polymerase sigma-70 factor (ECF subfamily)